MRTCDKCGGRTSPHIPRTRVGDELWCAGCATSHRPRTAALGRHPDLDESLRLFGCHHTHGGRILGMPHLGASQAEQETRLADESGWRHEHTKFAPVRFAIEGARAYNAKVGLGDPHEHDYAHVKQDRDTVRSVGRAYDALPEHQDHALPHFEAMRREVGQQYHHLTHTMGINVQTVDHDPYENVHHLVNDVATNKRLKVLGTHVTGGHPHFSDHENDQFRAVHDFFGHAATGRDFSRHGEQAAFLAHARMFSHHALPAMTSETKGQNTSLILNGHFGPQKIALLPKEHWDHTFPKTSAWTPEDAVRFEVGRQKVHTVNGGAQLCPEHLHNALSRSDFANGVAAQAGLPHHYDKIDVSEPHEGRCVECARGQSGNDGLPWMPPTRPGQRPVHEERAPVGHGADFEADEDPDPRARWPHRPLKNTERHVPVQPLPHSLNSRSLPDGRVALVVRRGYAVRAPLNKQAHDSGDGETLFHCPFCGSGQIIARSDGTTECEFCNTAFTVQVQPQMPAFPQTVDGVPMDVPGMPNGGKDANVPPGAAPGDPNAVGPDGLPTDGSAGGDDAPFDDTADDGGDASGDDDQKPAFLKGSMLYRTAAGRAVTETQYMRHLALTYGRDRETALDLVRQENSVRYTGSTVTASEDDMDYRMQHRAPGPDEAPAHDLTQVMPEDVYTHPHYYGGNTGDPDYDNAFRESHSALSKIRNKPEAKAKIYRALPAEHAHKGFQPGDWVSLSKTYARQHAMQSDAKHDWPVISAVVQAKHLNHDGNDLNELGYNGPQRGGMVAFKGGYHQEVRHAADGTVRPVQRRGANPLKGFSFLHDGGSGVTAYAPDESYAGHATFGPKGEVKSQHIEPEHAHLPLVERMGKEFAKKG